MQLDVVADLEAADHVEQLLQRDALGVELQLRRRSVRALAGREDAQVAEHLALVREERRVAPFARGEVGQLVGDLAVEELHGAGAGQRELAALGAVEQAAALADDAVLCGERACSAARESVSVAATGSSIATLGLPAMGLADTFQQIVDSLPDDWTDLELDMRIADESRYVEAALYLTTCNARPYSKHDWHWRLLVAHRFGHAASAPTVHGTLALLDDAGIEAELARARDAQRARRDHARMGAPAVGPRGVPQAASAVADGARPGARPRPAVRLARAGSARRRPATRSS